MQRLLPDPVPCEDESLAGSVPERDREHPAQLRREVEAVLLVDVRDDRGVPGAGHLMAALVRGRAERSSKSYSSPLKTATTSPDSFSTGWSPVSRSTTSRRRWPRTQRPSAVTPPESGPRWTSASVMRATTSGSAGAEGDTSPLMPHTTRKRYAVVSCHVERPLDDEVWSRFSALPGAPAGRVRDRRAAAPGRRRGGGGRGNVARARAGGRGARAARSPHALDGSRPRSPDRRCDRRASARGGPTDA